MTATEAAEILRHASPDLPLVVLVGGVWREVEAVALLRYVTYLPADALLARGEVVGVRVAD